MCHPLLLKTLDSATLALRIGCWIQVQQYWVMIGIRHGKVVHCGLTNISLHSNVATNLSNLSSTNAHYEKTVLRPRF